MLCIQPEKATEIQDDKLRLGDFKPKDTLSTKRRTLRETLRGKVIKKGNKEIIDKNYMKDAKRYMRILNYFREFSDVYFEKMGLQLDDVSESRNYFRNTK